jgi:hypothetical protein
MPIQPITPKIDPLIITSDRGNSCNGQREPTAPVFIALTDGHVWRDGPRYHFLPGNAVLCACEDDARFASRDCLDPSRRIESLDTGLSTNVCPPS